MQAEQQSEREAFEARTRKLSPCANLSRQKEVFGGHYRTTTIQRAWEQWQAAVEWQKQQARATLSHPSTPQGWQPIETAPESGYFMVYEDGAYRLKLRHDGRWLETAYPAIESSPWGEVLVGQDAQRLLDSIRPGLKLVMRDGCCENPTHWMPLPPPPEQGGPNA